MESNNPLKVKQSVWNQNAMSCRKNRHQYGKFLTRHGNIHQGYHSMNLDLPEH